MAQKTFTCTVCPIGCELNIVYDENNISDDSCKVSGNTCKRGELYAKSEIVNPQRTITSTVRTTFGIMLPVKSSAPIPKDRLFEAMSIINSLCINKPIRLGDIILQDFILSGVNLVACANIN